MKNKIDTRMLVSLAMLSALSVGLSYIEFTPPFSPSFMKLDISDLPAMLATFTFSPLAGVAVVLVKNLIGLISSNTGGIGQLANFIVGGSMAFSAGLYYKKHRTLKGALIALLIGTGVISIVGAVMNYFVLLPLYANLFIPMDKIIEMFNVIMPFINTKLDIALYNSIPFNLVKGLMISLVTFLLYKRLRPILKGKETV